MKYTFTEKELTTPAAPKPPALPRRVDPASRKGGAGKWILALLVFVIAVCVVWRCTRKNAEGTVNPPVQSTGTKTVTPDGKVTAAMIGQIKAYLTPSEAEVEQLRRSWPRTFSIARG